MPLFGVVFFPMFASMFEDNCELVEWSDLVIAGDALWVIYDEYRLPAGAWINCLFILL